LGNRFGCFEIEMTKQRERARQAGDFKTLQKGVDIGEQTQFLGYEQLENSSSVQALIKEGELVEQIEAGEQGIVVLAISSFYAESGGQIGDCGTLSNDTVAFVVNNTQRQKSGAFEHHGILNKGLLKVGDVLTAIVDKKSRKRIARNHSATHLLHAALKNRLYPWLKPVQYRRIFHQTVPLRLSF
jgi:alanyl-tRNA synthetase